ncbi:Membrane protein involved in the export ofO-antigen teichoic acid lipoteichoic acid [Lactiplantibacillus plantarum]|uniref:flippase n=1 Tax=Lactiplantibacillus plantarum TaxID=1590 RepID=UPI0005029FDF|nr:flippase [Lactiplantibacillus plantarum]KFL89047.1 membrane protein involved in the export of O-antigen, teichoic acid lipoteichoic acid [Lactiplantibacillus plantarum]KZU16410.1 Membrane protein involved in the export ofO-antigen teichoic acid lipoteichoic acid [Lactiplantibacillus plantarum]
MRIIRNYFYTAGYNLLILLTPLLTVPYISRVLGPTGVGINATTNSIITYFLLFGTVGITIYGNREIAFIRDNRGQRSQTFWEIEILQLLTISCAYLAFLVFLFFEHQLQIYFFYQSFYIIAGAVDISWYFMGLEDFKKTVLRNMLVKIASVIAIFAFVKTRQDTGIYILILASSQVLGNLTLWPYLRHSVERPNWRQLNLFRHLRPSLALFVPQIATTVYLALNKTMLWQMDSLTAAGFYDYSDKLIKLVLALVTATGTVMLPHIANLFMKQQLERVKQYLYMSFDFVLAIAIPMALGVAAVATTLAPLFFGRAFGAVDRLLMIEAPVIILIGMSNVLGQQFLLPTKQTKTYTISVTIGALVNIACNIPLIWFWGVAGAMCATLISEVCVTGYQLFITRHVLHAQSLFTGIWKYTLAGGLMFTFVFRLNVTMTASYLNLCLQIGVGVLLYLGLILLLQPPVLRNAIKLRNNLH